MTLTVRKRQSQGLDADVEVQCRVVLDLEHVDLVQLLDLLNDSQGDESCQTLAVGRALTKVSCGS